MGMSRIAYLAAAVVFVAAASAASALPLSPGERRCVTAVDKSTAALAKTQGTSILDCLKQAAKGDLGALPTVEACVAGDAKGRMAKRRLSVLANEPLKCQAGNLPSFAVPRLGAAYLPAPSPAAFDPLVHEVYAETTLTAVPAAMLLAMRDAFGDPLDAGALLSSVNPAGAACQSRVAKAIAGCARAQRKAVLTCKKKSLAAGTGAAAALESECLATNGNLASGFPDAKGLLAAKCDTALDAVLSQYCAAQVATALPGACAAAVDTGACLVDRIACRVCQETNTAGGLARDCDLLDDGLDNASCATTVPQCGNDVLDPPGEQCDDGNLVGGDCCSATCQLETTPCPDPTVVLDSPAHGSFTQAAQVTVSGHVTNVNANDADLTVNGVAIVVQPDKTFSLSLTADTAGVFTPAFARLVRQRDGARAVDRIVVIAGAARAAAAGAPSGLALRLNDSGFDLIEPLLSALVPPVDLSGLLQPGTVLLNDVCYLNLFGSCLGTADVAIGSMPPPGIGGIGFDIDAQTGKLVVSLIIQNLTLPLTVTGVTGAPLSCEIQVNAPAIVLAGDYGLSPLATDPTRIDVAQLANVVVTTPGLATTTTCSGSLGGATQGLITLLVNQLVTQLANSLGTTLNQADANGNTPVAAALETIFAALDLGTLLGTGLGLDVDAPYTVITEDPTGISFAADLGAAALTPAPGAPTLAAYLHVPETFPAFTAATPVGALPFDVAVGLSTSAMNALLRAQTEQGLLQLTTAAIDLGGGSVALTAGLLAPALPGFAVLPPSTPLALRLVPTLAPVLTGNGAASGEIGELRLGHLRLEVVENPGVGETVHLAVAVDARFDVAFAVDGTGLTFSLAAPTPADVTVAVLVNPLGTSEAAVAALVPTVLTGVLPDLAGALGTIPLPGVVGQSVEVSRSPFYTVFAEFGSLL